MSSNARSSAKVKLVAVVAAIAVFAVAAFLYYFVSRPSGPPAAATSLASLMPADTPLLAWTTDIDSLLKLGRDAGLDGAVLADKHAGFGAAVERLGANPLTAEGLKMLGIDTSGSLGLAISPGKQAQMIIAFYVPMNSGESLPKRLAEVFQKMELSERVKMEEGELEGKPIAWLHPVRDGEQKPGFAAFLEVDGGALVLFPANGRRSEAPEIAAEISAFAATLLAGPGEPMSSLPAYGDIVEKTDGALVAAFFNPGEATRTINLGDVSAQMLFWIMASAQGVGFSLVEDGAALRLRTHTVLESADVAAGGVRDLAVMDLIPGHPIAGLHLAIDLERALAELERTLPKDVYESHPVVIALTAKDSFLGIDEKLRVLDLVSGELGLFLGQVGETPEDTLSTLVGFIGVGDALTSELAVRLMKTFPGDQEIKEEVVGGTTIYRLESLPGSPSLMLKDGRLWFAGSQDALAAVARGERGHLTDGDRNVRIASVMREEGSLALYVDLNRVVSGLLPLLGTSFEEMGPAGKLLDTLDYLTFGGQVDGTSVHSEFALYSKGASFRKTTLAAVLATVDGEFGAVREMTVEVAKADQSSLRDRTRGEAQHNLHKIYYGAATYYETPSSSRGGDVLPCQFPPSQPFTPSADCCADGTGQCPGISSAWSESSTWRALSFSLSSPHSCVYSFESTGSGATAQFTATARCDADCDGHATIHKMSGKAGPETGNSFCEMSADRKVEVFEE
jgi:hypothetical protein